MSFMGRNINLALVALLVIVVLLALGSAVLYQKVLTQRTSDYERSSSNLSQCQDALDSYRSRLDKTMSDLNASSQDISKYDTLYEQKVVELGKTQSSLKDTQGQLNTVTLQKEQFKNLYGQALLNISALQDQVSTLQDRVSSLNDDIDTLRSQLDACQNP